LEERLFDADASADTSRYFVVPSDGRVRDYARCRQYYSEDGVRALLKAAQLEPVGISEGSAPGLKKMSAKKS
jgi:hypothetical protein